MREPAICRKVKPDLFWAFRGWLTGESYGKQESIQYIQNIVFFIPFGFLFPKKKEWKYVFISALVLSGLIEITQYITALGWCEVDDVLSNTMGALIGFEVYKIYEKLSKSIKK